jgi:hypothetical protein
VLTLLHHVLLVVAVLALGAAALRAASALAPDGLDRVLVAAVFGATLVVAETLLLGLAGLGSNPIALGLAAGATWLGARLALPAWDLSPLDELSQATAAASPGMRLAIGAAFGVLLVLVVSFLRFPAVGIDGTVHHLPEIVNWIHSGHPGSELNPSEDFPTGAYPLTHEMLLTWSMSLSRSFVPIAVWPPAMVALLAVAGWVGLRRLGVGAGIVALAIVTVAVCPPIATGMNAPKNDLAALTWLAVTAALCVAAVRRPPLLAVAILAAGLSVGTKTTTGPLVVLVIGVALYLSWRRDEPPLPAKALLTAGFVAAVGVGGVWYIRNLIVHGSPLWPFVATPWGDDLPPAIARLTPSFVDRPIGSLEGRSGRYIDQLSGGLILMAGGMLAMLLTRARAVVLASLATIIAVVAWARAPFTGIADDRFVDLSLFVIRYLTVAVAAGAATLALASRARAWRGYVAMGLLAAATIWSAIKTVDVGHPLVPSLPVLATGALAGLAGAWLAPRIAAAGSRNLRIVAVVAAAVAAVALSGGAPGYADRHAQLNATFATPAIKWFVGQRAWRDGDDPISMSPQAIGPLAGDRLQHDIQRIPGLTPCPEIIARARRGYFVLRDLTPLVRKYIAPYQAVKCLAGKRPIYTVGDFRIYYRVP